MSSSKSKRRMMARSVIISGGVDFDAEMQNELQCAAESKTIDDFSLISSIASPNSSRNSALFEETINYQLSSPSPEPVKAKPHIISSPMPITSTATAPLSPENPRNRMYRAGSFDYRPSMLSSSFSSSEEFSLNIPAKHLSSLAAPSSSPSSSSPLKELTSSMALDSPVSRPILTKLKTVSSMEVTRRGRSSSIASAPSPDIISGLNHSSPSVSRAFLSSSSTTEIRRNLDSNGVLREGWVFRKSKASSRSQKRYVIIRTRFMNFFSKQPSSQSSSPEAILSLNEFIIGKNYIGNEYFVMMKNITGSGDFMFLPEDNQTDKWIEVIHEAQAALAKDLFEFSSTSPLRKLSGEKSPTVKVKRERRISLLFGSQKQERSKDEGTSKKEKEERKEKEKEDKKEKEKKKSSKKNPLLKMLSSGSVIIPPSLDKPQIGLFFGRNPSEITVVDPETELPLVVAEALKFLQDKCELPGLFRLSGSSQDIQELKRQYDKGETNLISSNEDPHVVTGLLKLFLRDMPIPLLTNHLYSRFLAVKDFPLEEQQKDEMIQLIELVCPSSQQILKHILLFLFRVSQHQCINLMGAENLGIVISPNILRRENASPMEIMLESKAGAELVKKMIEWSPFLFRSRFMASPLSCLPPPSQSECSPAPSSSSSSSTLSSSSLLFSESSNENQTSPALLADKPLQEILLEAVDPDPTPTVSPSPSILTSLKEISDSPQVPSQSVSQLDLSLVEKVLCDSSDSSDHVHNPSQSLLLSPLPSPTAVSSLSSSLFDFI